MLTFRSLKVNTFLVLDMILSCGGKKVISNPQISVRGEGLLLNEPPASRKEAGAVLL